LITVLPRHLIAATGMTDALAHKELPFHLPAVHLDMLWHERDARSPAHKWLRTHLEKMNTQTQRAVNTAPVPTQASSR
jgi:DNA-binding transcriptional LysR family regulator